MTLDELIKNLHNTRDDFLEAGQGDHFPLLPNVNLDERGLEEVLSETADALTDVRDNLRKELDRLDIPYTETHG